MPPRWLCFFIVFIWLAFNGWLFFNDLLPQFLPDQPPPFMVDLVEESQARKPSIYWTILHKDRPVLKASTRVEHVDNNPGVFSLNAVYTPIPGAVEVPIHGILIHRMVSSYQVNSAGNLLAVEVHIQGIPKLAAALQVLAVDFSADIKGVVEGESFSPKLTLQLSNGALRTLSLPEVPVASGASVLLPLHPLNRLRGLRQGQSWRMSVFDPLANSLDILQGVGREGRMLRAQVRKDLQLLRWRNREVPCLVVDYQADRFSASTWVAQERGLVLRQEAVLGDERWVMNRE